MPKELNEDKLIKYRLLLTLAQAQIGAIEAQDQRRLNLIIDRKWTVIRSLSGTKELLKTEPALSNIIRQIQAADQLAEENLRSRMGEVRTKLCQINRANTARHVYAQTARKKHPVLGLILDESTPRFFDIQS